MEILCEIFIGKIFFNHARRLELYYFTSVHNHMTYGIKAMQQQNYATTIANIKMDFQVVSSQPALRNVENFIQIHRIFNCLACSNHISDQLTLHCLAIKRNQFEEIVKDRKK